MAAAVQKTPVKSKHNGKWSCVFDVFSRSGEYLVGELTSAAVWFDADAARKAGERALEVMATTDKWPNMCEMW
jgi:hypothetical protein